MSGQRDPESGVLAIEAALMMPFIIGMLLVMLAVGRVESAGGTVDAAAREAARSVSLDRSGQDPTTVAMATVTAALSKEGVNCPNPVVNASVGPIDAGVPLQAVTVDLSCTVQVSDLFPAWVGGVVTMHGRFTSVIDRFRSQ